MRKMVDTENMKLICRSFTIATKIMHIELEKMDNNFMGGFFLYPFAMNAAFTIEIAFKLLISKKTKVIIKEHNLMELYSKLDCVYKSYIIDFFKEERIQEKTFNNLLKESSNIFVEARYNYEFGQIIPISFLWKLMNISSEIALMED